jgi:hypothetical protein
MSRMYQEVEVEEVFDEDKEKERVRAMQDMHRPRVTSDDDED